MQKSEMEALPRAAVTIDDNDSSTWIKDFAFFFGQIFKVQVILTNLRPSIVWVGGVGGTHD